MTNEQVQEEIMDVPAEVLKVAAPKVHEHDNATQSKKGFMSKDDKIKLDGIAPNADKTNIVIDSTLNDDTTSTNPVQARVIMAKIKSIKDTILSIVNEIDPTSEDKAVSGKAVADYVEGIINESEEGTAKSPLDAGAFNSLANIDDNGIYYIEQNPTNITCGNDTINVHGGYMHVKESTNVQTQNIIASNGVEYSRWKNTESEIWTNWKIRYMPSRQYNKEFIVNDHIYNFNIMENTSGYNILWNQSASSDRNYFITASTAGEWKHVALFPTPLQINGCYIFGNNVDNYDIKIVNSGMYLRSSNGGAKIYGINRSFFIPRNN